MGNNEFGQLGTGSVGGESTSPTQVTGLSGVKQVAASLSGLGNDVDALFDAPAPAPQQRFVKVLAKLLPYLQSSLGERAITQRLAEALARWSPRRGARR